MTISTLDTLTTAQQREIAKMIQKAGPISPTPGDVHVNQPLTNLSVAFMADPEMDGYVAMKVFPNVPVGNKSNAFFVYDRASHTRNVAAPRAPGTESAGTGYKVGTDQYNAEVYALHSDIDDQVRANSDRPQLNPDRDATWTVSEQMKINCEINWATEHFKTAVWDAEVAGASTGTAKASFSVTHASNNKLLYWDDEAATPVADMRNLRRNTLLTGSRLPNTLVLGYELFDSLCEHSDILGRINQGQSPGKPAQATEMDLASLFRVDRVLVMESIYNKALQGATGDYDFIGNGKNGLLCYVTPRPGLMMPSAGYTFGWSGYLGMSEMGTRIKQYRIETINSDRVEIEMAYDQKLVAAGMGCFLNGMIE